MTNSPIPGCAPKSTKPLVAVVGGPLLHTRLDLFGALRAEFDFVGIGASDQAREAFEARNLPFRQIPLGRGIDIIGDLAAYRQMRRLFRRLRPAVVHAFQGKAAVWGRIAARKEKVPVIVGTIEGLGTLYSPGNKHGVIARNLYETLQRSACRFSHLTVFQNESDREYFVSRKIETSCKSTIIPGLGIRTDIFDPSRFTGTHRESLRKGLQIPPGAPLITMVTRILRSKGVADFARAADLVRKRTPSAHFLLVGAVDTGAADAPTALEIEALKQYVTLTGPRTDVSEIFAASDIFVLPTLYREGMPRSLLEAMSMALPVVTTDVPGCRDAVEDGRSGIIVPPANSGALADAIARLIDDEPLRRELGRAARVRVIEQFSLGKIAALTASQYRRLLQERFGERYTPYVGFEDP